MVGIDSLAVLHGRLPPRAQGLVVEWASLRQAELRQAWDLAKRLETPGRIAPTEMILSRNVLKICVLMDKVSHGVSKRLSPHEQGKPQKKQTRLLSWNS